MTDDGDLLLQFAEKRDEACFRTLVERRIGFVYAVNLRRLRDPHLAQEATQSVFVALARKAARVARGPSVIGWLHRSSCYESRNLMRAQAHRTARESEALRLGTTSADPQAVLPLADVASVLDDILGELPEADRDAILARYFSNQSYAQIGASTGRSENAARMRVERALAKLRERLQRRGFDSTAAVLAGALPAYAVAAVPHGVTATIAQAALSGVAAATLPATFLALMNTTKITATVAGLAAASVIGFEVYQTNQLRRELRTVRDEHAQATQAVHDLERQVVALKARPALLVEKPATSTAVASAAAAPTPKTEPPEVPGISRKAPTGWHKNGNNPNGYEVGVDQLQTWGGMPSAYAQSKAGAGKDGFGGMMQSASADAFKNKRVRLSGWVKTEDANDGGGHLWLRVDGRNDMLQFDNMNTRAPKGTTDWQEYSVVLDVPDAATSLNYGFFVQGSGKMWVNGLTVQPVSTDVPSTDLLPAMKPLPKAPVNLGFTPN